MIHLTKTLHYWACAILISLAVSQAAEAAGSPGKTLTFVSFNTRYYGLGGEMENEPKDEKRQKDLKKFFNSNVPRADIYAFQEVVDVAQVPGVLVPATYNCLTYQNHFPKHQHVVLCVNPKYQILHEPNDDNDTIEEVAGVEGRSRPALHFILGTKAGVPLVRVVGVHLKAFPDQSATRASQARAIAKFLATVSDPHLPVVVTGDFNTFNQDEDAIDLIFNSLGVGLVKNPLPFTFRTEIYSSRFDQFYMSTSLKLAEPMWTYPICNVQGTLEGIAAVRNYNESISDHCPVSIKVKL